MTEKYQKETELAKAQAVKEMNDAKEKADKEEAERQAQLKAFRQKLALEE